jgi:hypothetical protein
MAAPKIHRGARFYILDTMMLRALCNLPKLEELHGYYREARGCSWCGSKRYTATVPYAEMNEYAYIILIYIIIC